MTYSYIKKDNNIIMKDIFSLFIVFFKISILAFGGGYVVFPLIRKEIVEKRKWVTIEDILNYYAIGQSTPGLIFLNVSTFIGYKRKGVIGALTATFGVICPSIIITTIISILLSDFSQTQEVQKALAGVRVSVAMLLFFTILEMIQKTVKNIPELIVMLASFSAMTFFDTSPITVVAISIIIGVTGITSGKST